MTKKIKDEDDNPSIGLLLCSEKSEAVAKYSVLADQQQLFASRYITYLPTEEELKHQLEKERAQLQLAVESKGVGND